MKIILPENMKQTNIFIVVLIVLGLNACELKSKKFNPETINVDLKEMTDEEIAKIKKGVTLVTFFGQDDNDLKELTYQDLIKFYDLYKTKIDSNVNTPDKTVSKKLVIDIEDILSDDEEKELEIKLTEFNKTTAVNAFILTTPFVEANEMEVFTTSLIKSWAEGESSLLIVLSTKSRNCRIEVGQDVVSVVSVETVDNVLKKYLLPNFKHGDYYNGFLTGLSSLLKIYNNPEFLADTLNYKNIVGTFYLSSTDKGNYSTMADKVTFYQEKVVLETNDEDLVRLNGNVQEGKYVIKRVENSSPQHIILYTNYNAVVGALKVLDKNNLTLENVYFYTRKGKKPFINKKKAEEGVVTDEQARQLFSKFKNDNGLEDEESECYDVKIFNGDLNQDQKEDLLLYYSCSLKDGGNTVVGKGWVVWINNNGTLKVTTHETKDLGQPVKIENNGNIHAEKYEYADDDSRCCPSIKKSLMLKFNGKDLVEVD